MSESLWLSRYPGDVCLGSPATLGEMGSFWGGSTGRVPGTSVLLVSPGESRRNRLGLGWVPG
jgi:hypothetical protein